MFLFTVIHLINRTIKTGIQIYDLRIEKRGKACTSMYVFHDFKNDSTFEERKKENILFAEGK